MSSKHGQTRKVVLVGCLAGLMVIGMFVAAVVWAADKQRPDYQGFDLNRPWFDGKPWDWMLDMFNQPSLKPQEEGMIQHFPRDSVPRDGVEVEVPNTMHSDGARMLRDVIPANPTTATPDSIANGRKMYNIYCAACHGQDGKAGTPVTMKGMPAPAIDSMIPVFSEAHFYNKIRYGGPLMPAYGFQTSQAERWDIVNYLKSQEFGK